MTDELWVVLLGEVKERGVRCATVVSLRDGPRQVFGPFDGHTDAAAFARQHGGITWNVRPPGSMQKWRESEADAHADG
jgi:hypothetical protein